MSTPYNHPAALDDEALARQCTFRVGKSSGPGGQHRNKVSTHVEVTHTPTGILAQAGERRSQAENKHMAMNRLRLALAVRHRTIPPPPGKLAGKNVEEFLAALDGSIGGAGAPAAVRSELWRSRVGGTRHGSAGRIAVNPDHHDYPALLAEALDVIATHAWEPKAAAVELGLTSSQLIKLVKDCPEALSMWNAERGKRGGHPLR